MIEAFGLTSNPRKAHPPAVDDVTFEACAGRVTALLGEAGAGKTTALRLMLELQQGRGLAYFRGRPLHRIAHPAREVGVLLGDVPGHPARSVRGHLRMLCAATGVPVRRADEVLEAVGLVSLREERLGTLSRGVDRRLGLACALLPDPHTLVLDEPTHGLSTREGHWLHRMLRAHAAQGGTVLFATADPKEAARAADRVVTLEAGRLVADQEATDFARTRLRPRVAVRSPHAARLAALLTKEARTDHRSVEVVSEGGNRLSVYGSTTAEVGEAAFRHGILVHQLADEVGDMGAGAGAEPAAAEEHRTADGAPATERRDTPGADRRQDTSGSPVTPQPRMSAGSRSVSQSRTADQEPGPELPANTAEHSAAAEQRQAESGGASADGPATAPTAPHAEPSGRALVTETPTVALSPRSTGAPAAARPAPAGTGSSASPAAPAASPEPPTHATAPDPMSATVPAQPPSTADSAQPSAAASTHPPVGAASAHSSTAAPAQPSAAASSAHPPAVTASARPPAGAASAHSSTAAAAAQAPAAAASIHASATTAASAPPQPSAASGQSQASAVSPQSSPRPVPDDPSARAASPQSPAPAQSGVARTARPPVEQPEPGGASTARFSARLPRRKSQTSEPPAAGGDPAARPDGSARRAQALVPDDSSPLPPTIAVRSAPSPLRPLRYELRRAAGIGTGFVTCGAVLVVSALITVLLARLGHTPQARLFAAWPRELPLPPAALGAGLLGSLAFGDEFRHPALAADRGTVPRRLGLLTAKLAVSGATAVLLSFLTLGCDAEMLYVVYGRELAKVPVDWLPMTASWFGLIVGCAWAGVLAAGVFRSTTAGLAAVLAVPVLVVPVVHKALQGSGVRMAAGLPMRMREMLLLQWPFGGERYLVAAARVLAQPVGGAMALSLAALLCAYLFTTLRARLR
ncbi:ATP-binding cassette domain-containing protein [Streptomyces sp. NPDC007157]|uniref:ABC transporter ATP-binding protein n=1 Tax=Streptomyces sp. NPDC007157 TaxID=3154681 RepID=UPI0033FBD80F